MQLDSEQQRAFAVDVVRRLAERGFTAYWAGGCVRDQLLGRLPKDYDVATNALPNEVRELFGRRRTHAVGASFGVITVVGPAGAGHVEVATFRRDVTYSDGRHPDAIEFSSPVDDASRRDFTINGLFYDPLSDEVIDLVGGRADLELGIVRAIGNPRARITEDKLRMLRGVRFAATFGFSLDAETRDAIADMAGELPVVSAERIAQEMRLMLVLPARSLALRKLHEVRLLAVVLPEVLPLAVAVDDANAGLGATSADAEAWQVALRALDALHDPGFPLALATALTGVPNVDAATEVCRRWKLSNKEEQRVVWLVKHHDSLTGAATQPWPVLQRLLIAPGIHDLIAFHQALAEATGAATADLDFCRECLALPAEELNPPPLVSGHDLIKHGLAAGATFQMLLEKIRDAQLVGQVSTRDEALALATQLVAEGLVAARPKSFRDPASNRRNSPSRGLHSRRIPSECRALSKDGGQSSAILLRLPHSAILTLLIWETRAVDVDWLMVIFRWMHILAAITAVGATIFMRQALVPAVATLPPADQPGFHDAVRKRWAMYVHISIGFLLLSGFYTFINYVRGYQFPEGSKYHMLFGIKFLLALAIFFIASMLVGRSEASVRFRQRREFWLTLNVVLAVVLVCISGILRFLPRTPKTPAEPAAATALLETNSLR